MTSDGSSTGPLLFVLELMGAIAIGTGVISYVTLKLISLAHPQRKEFKQQRIETRALKREEAMTHLRGLSIWMQAAAINLELGVRRWFRYTRYEPRHCPTWLVDHPHVG